MLKAYRFPKRGMNRENLAKLEIINPILEDYTAQGRVLTVRGLYYQLVGQQVIPNNANEYKNLVDLMTNARWFGLTDWDQVTDLSRGAVDYPAVEEPSSLIENLPDFIDFDHWSRQECYVEAWVEKNALVTLLQEACDPFTVPYLACKGNLSTCEVYLAGQRFQEKIAEGKNCVLLYSGDLDPSGVDMVRDITGRIGELCGVGAVEVKHIALNPEQAARYNLQPDFVKASDSKKKGFLEKFGDNCYELDALHPDTYVDLVTREIEALIDDSVWDESKKREAEMRASVSKLSDNWEEISEYIDESY